MTTNRQIDSRQEGLYRGTLYLVATPIGNLEDISMRAVRILKEVDQIACEDTRHTLKLLNHYEIHKPLVSYHEHNELTRSPELVLAMEQGANVALVSDAGMPLVSDPGYRLVTLAIRHHIPVVPIPGPSALLAALSASWLPSNEFLFVGFLPARNGERKRSLERLRIEDRTLIFYEAPHRVAEAAADALAILREPDQLDRPFDSNSDLGEVRGEQPLGLALGEDQRPGEGRSLDPRAHLDLGQDLPASVEPDGRRRPAVGEKAVPADSQGIG